VFAQDPAPGGWRRVGDPAPASADRQAAPNERPFHAAQADAFGQPIGQAGPQDRQLNPNDRQQQFPNEQPMPAPPPELTVHPGTFVTVRINQALSSGHNQPGDSFSATVAQPLVVDGVVVAQRGQMVYGRVAESEKARSSRPSRLGLELTGLTLVDGTQVSIRSQLVARQGGRTPTGDQVGTVATTTVVGAAVGSAVDWGGGTGAAIGAGVGAAAGAIGVLLTRNHDTVVYPETALTFRIDSPLTISTVRAPMAFRYVDPYEYDRPEPQLQARPPAPRPYYGPGYYPYTPFRWGPGISLVFGGGWYRGGYWGRGPYRRWR
jgi:hypothetical protein